MRTLTKVLIWMVVILAVFIGVVLAFFEPWTIPNDDPQLSSSVEPTLSAGDWILVSRSSNASDGALVRCADPDSPGRYVVGRVMGRAADVIDFKGGTLLIGNKIPSAPYACEVPKVTMANPSSGQDTDLNCFVEEFAGGSHESFRAATPIVDRDSHTEVPAGQVFLVSDNRALHLDSRDFGTVAPSTCQRIALRLWGSSGPGDSKKRFTVLW